MMNSDGFFLNSGSEQLEKVHGWARARYAAPWAVFFGVLLRVAASVPPSVQLPPVIGGRASLNLFCAFAGKSGSGKGASDSVARSAWPGDLVELPIGSGEGIAQQFANGNDVPVIFTVSEIDKLAGITGRAGSILLAELKSAAMGEPIGQANAKTDTRRIVPAHSYRMCLSVGAQPGHTRVIFGDTTGGTPQRFLWAPTIDPDMPELRIDPPAPLDVVLPSWEPGEDGVVEMVYGPPEIEQTIIAARLATGRGEGNALDTHVVLVRCKVAALLAIMHGRLTVSQWDWDQSAVVMAVSERTRAELVAHEEQEQLECARREGEKRAVMSVAQDDYLLKSTKDSVVRFLGEGEQSGSELKRRLGSSTGRRKCFDPAIAELTSEGVVEAVAVTGGARYRLTHAGHGDQAGQPPYAQVKASDHAGHGDHASNVISLQSSRSQKPGGQKVSCQKWFDAHIEELREQGHDTVDAFAVRAAGEAAGYKRGNVDVSIHKRGFKGTVWLLAG